MSKKNVLVDLNLNGNELQNAVVQNLATAPIGPKAGQVYYNTANNKLYMYNGTSWIDVTDAGKTYTFASPLSVDNNDEVSIDLSDYVLSSTVGAASGVCPLGSDSKISTTYLPSYVDDVVDAYIVSGATALSAGWLSATDGGSALTPETGKIYVVLSSGSYQNRTYRWSGSTYVEITSSPAQATESDAGIAAIATQSEITTGTNDTKFVTPLKLATRISGMAKKWSENNPALTASSGVCTWNIANGISPDFIVAVYEVSSGEQVFPHISYSGGYIVIKINSSSNISANTYKAVIIA